MTIAQHLLTLAFVAQVLCLQNAARPDSTWMAMGKIPNVATVKYRFINPEWHSDDVFPNSARPLQMEVRVETYPNQRAIKLNEIRLATADTQTPIREDPLYADLDSPAPITTELVQGIPTAVRVYRCNITITDKAKPQPYRLRMKFDIPTNWIEFEIPVGTRESSRLQINRDKDKTLTIIPKQQTTFSVALHNNYAAYPVIVKNIAVDCDPPNLIGRFITDPPTPFKIMPQTMTPVQIKVTGAGLTYSQMIQGEQSPTLSLRVDYDDGIVAQQKTVPPLSVNVKAEYNAADAYLWAFVGGFFGILLRLGVGGKPDGGDTAKPQSRQQVIREVLLSMVLVFVVLFLAQALKMEILAVERRFPFTSPIMGGVTGLFVGLFSPRAIIEKLRSLLNVGADKPAPGGSAPDGGSAPG